MLIFKRYIPRLLILLFIIVVVSSGCAGLKKRGSHPHDSPFPIGLRLEREFVDGIFGELLSQPYGIVADNLGNLYVADAGNNRLIKFDSELKPYREFGGFGYGEGLLNQPSYIYLDNNLNLYVSDAGNQRISIYDGGLNYVDQVELIDDDDPLKFGRPSGMTINEYGELLIADIDNARIPVFTAAGNFVKFFGDVDSYAGMLLTPSCVGRNREGDIVVGDVGNSKLLMFDSQGTYVFDIGRDVLSRPTGVDFDRFGNIWVVDSKLAALFCFGPRGRLLFSTQDPGTGGPYAFGKPIDLAMLPKDRIVVSDAGQNKLLVYKILYQKK